MKPTVAAFDFDGTVTYGDTLLPFLFYTHGLFGAGWRLFLELPRLIGFLVGLVSRQKVKEALLSRFYRGLPMKKIEKWGEAFAREQLPRHLKAEAMRRIAWHKSRKDTLVLISASIDAYLNPWASSAGFDKTLTSRLEADSAGRATGRLVGANCRGEEKLRRLTEALGPREEYRLYAYGDSRGDKDLLESADHSYYREYGENHPLP